jgi:hypothetical protein
MQGHARPQEPGSAGITAAGAGFNHLDQQSDSVRHHVGDSVRHPVDDVVDTELVRFVGFGDRSEAGR